MLGPDVRHHTVTHGQENKTMNILVVIVEIPNTPLHCTLESLLMLGYIKVNFGENMNFFIHIG